MFTGIIEEVGTILDMKKAGSAMSLVIQSNKVIEDVKLGDSIAVNGVCLTVNEFGSSSFTADVMLETLKATSLGTLKKGSRVNLERAMAANGRFGGHIVSGHIDGTGQIKSLTREDNAVWVQIAALPELLHYVVEKGSIAIDTLDSSILVIIEDELNQIDIHQRAQFGLQVLDVNILHRVVLIVAQVV